jgi:hypothetical protein
MSTFKEFQALVMEEFSSVNEALENGKWKAGKWVEDLSMIDNSKRKKN